MFSGFKERSDKRRIRKLFSKPPKKSDEAALVDFYNNEVIRIAVSNPIEESIAEYIDSLGISTKSLYDKPIIFNGRFPKKNGIIGFKHMVFIVGIQYEALLSITLDEFEEWNSECLSVFGFPLAPLFDYKSMQSLSNELANIVKYNDPMLYKEAEPILDLMQKCDFVYEDAILMHFNKSKQDKIQLLYQFSDCLYLSYTFSSDINVENLKRALIQSGALLDKYFKCAKFDYKPRFPVGREDMIRFMRNPNEKPYNPEIYELSAEAKELIRKFSLDFAPNEKLAILIKMAQDMFEFVIEKEKYFPVIEKLYKILQYYDTLFETSRIEISVDNKILLPDYNLEINMQPLHKAVYILFFRHPEGFLLINLDQHREELTTIYTEVSNRKDPEVIEKTINELLNPASNAINECMSRIREAFLKVLDEKIASLYYISGERGGVKRIEGV